MSEDEKAAAELINQRIMVCQELANFFNWTWWGVSGAGVAYPSACFQYQEGGNTLVLPYEVVTLCVNAIRLGITP